MPASVLSARKLWKNIEFVRWFLFLTVAIVGVAGDLISKSLTYEINSADLIPNILRFKFVINKGIIWGISSQGSVLFLIIPSLAIPLIVLIFKYIHIFSGDAKRNRDTPAKLNLLITIAFGLILAGAVGNLFDRIFYKGVRDFIDFYFINWPIFNMADVYISSGVGLIIIDVFWTPRPHRCVIVVKQNELEAGLPRPITFSGSDETPQSSPETNPDTNPEATDTENALPLSEPSIESDSQGNNPPLPKEDTQS
jgi:signal peptidase II